MNDIRIAVAATLVLLAGCAGQHVRMSEDHRKTLTEQPVHADACAEQLANWALERAERR